MHVWMHVCVHEWLPVCVYAWPYVCLSACLHILRTYFSPDGNSLRGSYFSVTGRLYSLACRCCADAVPLLPFLPTCVGTRRLASETKAWVSETGKVGFGNWGRRFWKLGNQELCLRSVRNGCHFTRPTPPAPPISIAKPTRTVAETDKTSC